MEYTRREENMITWENINKLLVSEESVENYRELEEFCDNCLRQTVADEYMRNLSEKQFVQILTNETMYDGYFIFLLSFLMKAFQKQQYVELFLEVIVSQPEFTPMNKIFILHQVKTLLINYPKLETEKVGHQITELEGNIRAYLENTIKTERVTREQRTDNLVFVMVAGFLGENHPVSRSALERCYMLQKQAGKRVRLISAGECCTMNAAIPMYQIQVRNRAEEYTGIKQYKYLGEQIELYQSDDPADSVEGIQKLIEYIEEERPEYILYVGEQSFIADMANQVCPVITISTTFSAIQNTRTEFLMTGRKVSDAERKMLYPDVIEIPFTFQLKKRKQIHTRNMLKIPESRFALVIVGMRLNADITDEFLESIKAEIDHGCYLVFIGKYDKYQMSCQKYPWLLENSTNLGVIDDVVGVLPVLDLYINPFRLGGGYSVAEAFDAGIPAVSIDYGDVATAAGSDFCVKDYVQMNEIIEKYRTEPEFYQEMVKKAKKRLEELTDEESAFLKGLEIALNSSRFY